MENFPLALQAVQGVHGLGEGGFPVGPVDQIEVNVIGLQVPQGAFALPDHGLWGAVPDVGPALELRAALGGDDHLLPEAQVLEDLAHVALRRPRVVGRGGVDQVDAAVHGGPDGLQAAVLGVVVPPRAADAPGAQSHLRHLHACVSKGFVSHSPLLPRSIVVVALAGQDFQDAVLNPVDKPIRVVNAAAPEAAQLSL